MDRWPMELFEQLSGLGAEKSDLAAAWQDFRYKRMQRDRSSGEGAADRAAKAYAATKSAAAGGASRRRGSASSG